ncbi:MAG: hypothetical protein ACU85U_07940 [Gammaproteobacteria bacterium]|jgi:phenylpropionate dioxygenase-like ring-hydroxylating dioxygenase large terminal subunit
MHHTPIDASPIWSANYNEIPKEVFTRPDIFEAELERIFYGDEWHPVAHVGEIPKPQP